MKPTRFLNPAKTSRLRFIHWTAFSFVSYCVVAHAVTASAAAEYRDTLEKAMLAPSDIAVDEGDTLNVFVADQFEYDTNLYRLPAYGVDLSTLVGLTATRQDHINTSSVGVDAQWIGGRQVVNIDLRADDNRFARNGNLDNVSGNDRLIWNWRLGPLLSGQIGATYYSSLASFVNSSVYSRNEVNSDAYFGSARYQIGPLWALYGGAQESKIDLSAAASKGNDNHDKVVDLGTEYATNADSTVGFEFRFSDLHFLNNVTSTGLNSIADYREDLERVLFKYALAEKTTIDANAGYLKRNYVGSVIPSYAGDVWHVSLEWQATEKSQLAVDAWRKLQAYLTAESDYFTSQGVSLTPLWVASEKVRVTLPLSWEVQRYIELGGSAVGSVQRRDTVTAGEVDVIYTPVKILILKLSYHHEIKNSNKYQDTYDDNLALANFTLKF